MSEAFSDDLSDPTPSPPPAAIRASTSNKSSAVSGNNGTSNNTRRGSTATSKATAHQRTTSAASASARTPAILPTLTGHKGATMVYMNKLSANTSSASASHSRTASLANSLVMSQSGGKGTMVNGSGARSDDGEDDEEEEEEEEEGSQSGSDLSSAPSEGGDQPKRVITDEHQDANDEGNEEENEEGEEDDGEEDEKGNDEDEDDNEDENPFAVRPQPRHGRTASGGAGPGIVPPRATRQSSLRSGSAAGRTGRGVIPAGMWEWAKKKNSRKPKTDKSDDGDDGSEGEDGEDEDDEECAGAQDRRPADSRDESLVQPAANAVGEDEPMLNGTNAHSPNGTVNSDYDFTTQHLPIPTVKVEPPPSATMSSFRPQDLRPSPSVSPTPTTAPAGPSERRTNGRSKTSGRTNSKRSHRHPPAPKRSTAAQQQQQQFQLQQQLLEAEDEAEAEEVERANRQLEVAEDAEGGDDDDGELEGEGEYGNRQDALDALSLLELKFALVRQRIYQDKMEELGREERLVKDGSHPELLHTYIELDKRKERRATLADLKRKREVDLAAVTRRNDEDAIWSWWMIQKDVVQSTLVTEASRKRRRVERERRALLDPLRRTLNRETPPLECQDRDGDDDMLPSKPSTKAILAVALRHPYARLRTYESTRLAKNKVGEGAVGPAGVTGGKKPKDSMPTLSQLNQELINEDLEVLLGYRRGSGALGAVITAGAGPGMPEVGIPAGMGAPGNLCGAPGMDNGMSGTITVNNAAVAPTPEAFNPAMGGMGPEPGHGSMLDYPRSIYELQQRERGTNREGQAFNDHLAAHQYSSAGMPPNGSGKSPGNGRERERERERAGSKKYSSSNAPSMSHGSYVSGPSSASQQQQQQQHRERERETHSHSGYLPHSHRQTMDPYASPGLGLQNMQRLPETGNPRDRDRDVSMGIQHMPLPPAPSTIPAGSSSGASKHHHHHPVPHPPPHPQSNQHPSLMWEGGRREREREREGDLARERSHSGASRNPGMSGPGYATNPGPPSGNGGVSGSGRPHSHSVFHPHPHPHYHPTHTHSRSSAQGSTAHNHSHSVLHTHPHSHPQAAGPTSHLHVIHNHGPGPAGNGGSAGNGAGGSSSSSSSRRNNAYDDSPSAPSGSAHRTRTAYPSGPTMDREKELRERERNVMHPSLSHGGGQERDRHGGYVIPHSSRESWNDRDRERVRPKERDDRRDQDRERERDRAGHSQSGISGFTSHQPAPTQHQQQPGGGGSNRGSRSGSLSTGMHPSQGNIYSQSQAPPGSRYAYANSSAYSPPSTQVSQSRRNSPPPLLPPVPNTSRYSTGVSTHRRGSPSPTDPLSYSSSSQVQAEIIHSPTSSLNPPGFNPWSAPPRSSGRPYRPSPPPQKIAPPTGTSFNSSAGGGPLNPLPGPTLSPILPSAVSPAPRPSISPAPRPPSSSSLHAILQPSPRESAITPQPVRRNGSGSGEGGSGVGPMELDPPMQQQQTGFRHPSLAPLNPDGK